MKLPVPHARTSLSQRQDCQNSCEASVLVLVVWSVSAPTWEDEGVVSLCRHVQLALLCVEGCKGCAAGIHSPAIRPVICLLSSALRHLCGVGQGQHNGPAVPAPLLLYPLSPYTAKT